MRQMMWFFLVNRHSALGKYIRLLSAMNMYTYVKQCKRSVQCHIETQSRTRLFAQRATKTSIQCMFLVRRSVDLPFYEGYSKTTEAAKTFGILQSG